jgi:hypothetical protein
VRESVIESNGTVKRIENEGRTREERRESSDGVTAKRENREGAARDR